MMNWRKICGWMLAGALVVGCYLFEGGLPIWRREFPFAEPNICLIFVGYCHDGRELVLVENNSGDAHVVHYELSTGKELHRTKLPPEAGHPDLKAEISGDGDWFLMHLGPNNPQSRQFLLHRRRDDQGASRFETMGFVFAGGEDVPVHSHPKSPQKHQVNTTLGQGLGDLRRLRKAKLALTSTFFDRNGQVREDLYGSFSPDSRLLAHNYVNEIRIIDLKSKQSVERYPIPDASFVKFTTDSDWLVAGPCQYKTTTFAIQRSTKRIVTVGEGYPDLGLGQPQSVALIESINREISISSVDITTDPPRRAPTILRSPRSGLGWRFDQRSPIVGLGPDPYWRWKARNWLSDHDIPIPTLLSPDVQIDIPTMLTQLAAGRNHPVNNFRFRDAQLRPTPLEAFLCIQQGSLKRPTTIGLWPRHPPARRWTWLLIGVMATASVFSWQRHLRKNRATSPPKVAAN